MPLFLGDLVMTKVVAPPEDKYFVEAFLKMHRGAAMGLQRLSILPVLIKSPTKSELPGRAETTLLFYRHLCNILHKKGLDHLMPDILHYEHLLCKVLRVFSQGPEAYRNYLKNCGYKFDFASKHQKQK